MVRASRALSIPVALIVGLVFLLDGVVSSREERSRVPRVFFCAVFAFPLFAVVFSAASSSARSAAFSAFFRAASAALAAAASLEFQYDQYRRC
jgi:hypothetical protein